MKTVFKSSMVAHVWAQQSQPVGHNAGRTLYFRGPTIYSYGPHFPIATMVISKAKARKGCRAALFNTARYSMSTSRHQSRARRAIPSTFNVFHVPHLGLDAYRHADNLASYKARIADEVKRTLNARIYTNAKAGHKLTREANDYAAFFGLRWRLKAPVISPEVIAKATERRRVRNEKREANMKLREEQNKLDDAEKLARWLAGEVIPLPRAVSLDEQGSARLRVRGDKVETSHGAQVPVEDARRALAFVRRVASAQSTGIHGEWRRNGEQCPLGHFQIDRILPSGDIYVGCHFITRAEIERIAVELGA